MNRPQPRPEWLTSSRHCSYVRALKGKPVSGCADFLTCLLLTTLACLLPAQIAMAGGFVFSGEGIEDGFTHPSGYYGSGGVLTVSVCIEPNSPNAAEMEISVRNIVATYSDLQAVTPNIILGDNNDIAPDEYDFESVAAHEIGHCLGLAHPNLGSFAGVTNTNSTVSTNGANDQFEESPGIDNVIGSGDDLRGDDTNLHWFRLADNNPFVLGTIFDSTTYSVDLSLLPDGDTFAANADRTVGATVFGVEATEAVLQQGIDPDEDRRQLQADDVATLRLGMSGVDRLQGTSDDYELQLTYAGLTDQCDIMLRFDDKATGFAACGVGGTEIASGHYVIQSAVSFFNTNFNWFFNDKLRVSEEIFSDGFESGNTDAWIVP